MRNPAGADRRAPAASLRRQALLLLGAGLALALALWLPAPPVRALQSGPMLLDPMLYHDVMSQLHAGGSYYDVLGSALRTNGYATRSVFNWRTPLHWTALAPLTPGTRRLVLTLLGVLAGLVAIWTARTRSSLAAIVTAAAALGVAILVSAPGAVGMGEAWAGLFVGLSVCAYALEHRLTGVACGLLAIFIRELAAPYVLICAFVAWRQRRWRELGCWIAGGVAYLAYFAVHVSRVWAHQLPGGVSQDGWVAFGGIPFVLSTVRWNGLLLLSPAIFTALAFTVIASGSFVRGVPVHLRLASTVYLVLFLFVGQDFNRYWGYLTWPTWMLACGYGADGLATALLDLTGRRARPDA